MKAFDYFEPATLDEAVALLQEHDGNTSILAGGTDLLVEIKEHLRAVDTMINIKKIRGLDHLTWDEEQGLRIGSLASVRRVETAPFVLAHYAGLAQAASELGSIQVRNRATIAGNICRASPSADTLPPLIADQAQILLYGPHGQRVVPMGEFFTGPGRTVMDPAEILIEITVPPPPPHTGKAYIKHGRRKAMELATVGIGVTLTLREDICREIRIVLGAVAPTPIRAPEAEALLRGHALDDKRIAAAAAAAMEESRPISDVRSSARYRREMVRVQTGRAVKLAYERARVKQ
ncbi:MAG: xanthine dehydrogenase family protein subunit M [Candidatus Promineifilaceae bacterium]|nr:xanthine dehydrogenase family protein subunit M [Candidatus Promineifilaceae bacterium]